MVITKRKTIIGIIMVVLSIALLVFWEVSGRELCTTREVLASAVQLKAGDTINIEEMSSVRVPSDTAAQSWLSPALAQSLDGRICAVDIAAGEPLTEAMFREKNQALENGRSVFRIPSEWIASRPAMLRAGDVVTLYSLPEQSEEGTFEIAFTRDSAEQAITGDEASSSDVLSRNSSSGIIDSVEIICTPEDFFELYALSLTSGRKVPEPSFAEESAENAPYQMSGPEELLELGGDASPEDPAAEGESENGENSGRYEVYEPGEPFLLFVLKETR